MSQLIQVGAHTFKREDSTRADNQALLGTNRPLGERAFCQCRTPGIEMYIGHRSGLYYLAKMPGTGRQHHPECRSFDMDDEHGEPVMKGDRYAYSADFPFGVRASDTAPKIQPEISRNPAQRRSSSHRVAKPTISLVELLRLMWNQAELNRWVPKMEGKRAWGLVRHLLYQQASAIAIGNVALESRLLIPESFKLNLKDAHRDRVTHDLQKLLPSNDELTVQQTSALVIGLIKEYQPSKHGSKVQLKHLPEEIFYVDNHLAAKITETFTFEILGIGRANPGNVLCAMSVRRTSKGYLAVNDMALLRLTPEWIHCNNSFELELIAYLLGHSRSFVTGSERTKQDSVYPAVCLTDTGGESTPLYIDVNGRSTCSVGWVWRPQICRVSELQLPEKVMPTRGQER